MVPDFVAIALRSLCGAGAVIGLESVLAAAKVVAAELAPPPAAERTTKALVCGLAFSKIPRSRPVNVDEAAVREVAPVVVAAAVVLVEVEAVAVLAVVVAAAPPSGTLTSLPVATLKSWREP